MSVTASDAGETARLRVARLLTELPVSVMTRQPMGEGLGGEPEFADFVIHDSLRFPKGLAFKVSSQNKGGTVDRKLYALGVNIPAVYPIPTVVVLVGDGFRSGIVDWLKTRIGHTLRAVLTFDELEAWLWSNL